MSQNQKQTNCCQNLSLCSVAEQTADKFSVKNQNQNKLKNQESIFKFLVGFDFDQKRSYQI